MTCVPNLLPIAKLEYEVSRRPLANAASVSLWQAAVLQLTFKMGWMCSEKMMGSIAS
jgi:hypothetical protein